VTALLFHLSPPSTIWRRCSSCNGSALVNYNNILPSLACFSQSTVSLCQSLNSIEDPVGCPSDVLLAVDEHWCCWIFYGLRHCRLQRPDSEILLLSVGLTLQWFQTYLVGRCQSEPNARQSASSLTVIVCIVQQGSAFCPFFYCCALP